MDSSGKNKRKQLTRKIMIDLAVMTIIGVGLALIGPLGSFAMPLPNRLIVWLGFSYAGYLIYSPMAWVVNRLHMSLDLPKAGLWFVAVVFATVPMTILVGLVGYLPGEVRLPSLAQFYQQFPYVFVIGGGVTMLFTMLERRDNIGETATKPVSVIAPVGAQPVVSIADSLASQPDNGPRLLDRIPAHLGSGIIALENEDHYVRVHTELGSELVLIRMRDAVAEIDGVDGAQVHRSWWVARDGVADVAREGRNVRLQLSNGLQAPVSRARVQELRDAGWF